MVLKRLKFCGLSRHRIVDHAASLGATHVGFVVQAPESHREVSLTRALELIEETPLDLTTVIVTPTHDADELRQAADVCRPDVVQVCGDVPAEKVAEIREDTGVATWRAVDLENAHIAERHAQHQAIVLDALDDGYGGHGDPIDWTQARQAAEPLDGVCLVLAGGLTPDNVDDAMDAVDAWGVDVSSSIETDRTKDPDKMAAFARAVQEETQ